MYENLLLGGIYKNKKTAEYYKKLMDSKEAQDKRKEPEIPLFKMIPKLRGTVPYVSLTNGPTPIFKMEKLGELLGHDALYCKDDGVTATGYGGNKPRKLEFILSDALSKGAKRVITYGGAGSNHALATAAHAKTLGMACTAILCHQPKTISCHKNLMYHSVVGTELILSPFREWNKNTEEAVQKWEKEEGVAPYIVPGGGTCVHGVLGYINAVLELGEQIKAGVMPSPDVIYVAAGTFGTVAGITIGLKLLKEKATVKPIRVSFPQYFPQTKYDTLLEEVCTLLKEKGEVPIELPDEKERKIIDDYYGAGYAVETPEYLELLETIVKLEKMELETTYTIKPMTALIDDIKKGNLEGKVALFWRTNNSNNLIPIIEKGDAQKLPKEFQDYIKSDFTMPSI